MSAPRAWGTRPARCRSVCAHGRRPQLAWFALAPDAERSPIIGVASGVQSTTASHPLCCLPLGVGFAQGLLAGRDPFPELR
jgi:hypothetical protein